MLVKAIRGVARGLILADERHGQILARLDAIEQTRSTLPRALTGTADARERILSLAKLLQPHAAAGQDKVRVGRKGDGGYVMISDFKDIGGALSFGVGDDISWDLDIAARGIQVHQFDHSIDAPPETHSSIVFHRTKVQGLPNGEGETLESILANTAVDPTRDWILKIDIEDDEWAVFDATPDAALRRLKQIVCEFHNFQYVAIDQQRYERCLSVLRKLVRLFDVVHVHANNHSPMVMIGGVPFPDVIEVTFASREHYKFHVTDEIFPTPLDSPNKSTVEDYFLGRFAF